jgi:hypothetical protein
MAKFGQLLLQKGMWKGKQVLPKEWVEEATTAKIQQSPNATEEQKANNDWIQGYGYQFWRCRHNAFRADGAFGQYIIVMPEKDAVVAITSETKEMQGIMNMVWDHILPALHDGELPQNEEAVAALQQKLKALALPMPSKGVASPLESSVSGKRYAISENDRKLKSVQFQFKQNQCSASLEYDDASYTLPFGASGWAFSESTRSGPNLVHAKNTLKGLPPFKIASAYRWASDNTLELTLRYIESPHTETLLAIFDGERVALELKNSIDPKSVALEGKQN